MNKSNLFLASVLAILFTSILIIFSPNSKKLSLSSPTPSPISTESISSTLDPTTDWKTYNNEKYNFIFKYPQNWILDTERENDPDGGVSLHSLKEYKTLNKPSDSIELSIFSNTENLSILEWMKNNTAYSNFDGQEYSPIIIDGKTGYIYTWEGMGSGLTAILAKDENIYKFSSFRLENEFTQILSTFKFTDKTNCWQNDQLKISFDLPNNNWQCDSENEWIMNLNSDLYTIRISNLGRGPYCFDDVNEPNNPCIVKPFLLNDKYTFELYTFMGENKEILGDLGLGNGTWVSIKYKNMEKKSLTSAQKQELSQLFNSLKILP